MCQIWANLEWRVIKKWFAAAGIEPGTSKSQVKCSKQCHHTSWQSGRESVIQQWKAGWDRIQLIARFFCHKSILQYWHFFESIYGVNILVEDLIVDCYLFPADPEAKPRMMNFLITGFCKNMQSWRRYLTIIARLSCKEHHCRCP